MIASLFIKVLLCGIQWAATQFTLLGHEMKKAKLIFTNQGSYLNAHCSPSHPSVMSQTALPRPCHHIVWSCVVLSRASFRQLVDAHAGIHPTHPVDCCVDAPA